jgi:hypothetical protein
VKRTPLKRKTPLRSSKTYKRYPPELGLVPLLKRVGLAPISARRRAQKAADGRRAAAEGSDFRRAVVSVSCVVCGRSNAHAVKETGFGIQAHHGVPQAVLRRLGLRHLLWDPDNAVAVCEEPCHRRHTGRQQRILRAQLPRQVEHFAARHGLLDELAREYPR